MASQNLKEERSFIALRDSLNECSSDDDAGAEVASEKVDIEWHLESCRSRRQHWKERDGGGED